MSTVYVMCGLPGSGKSTWAKNKAKEANTVIVSPDAIRTMLFGEYRYDEAYEPTVLQVSLFALYCAVAAGEDVVFDEVSLSREERRAVFNTLAYYHKDGAVKVVCVNCRSSDNLANRMKDSRGYPKERWVEVIETMRQRYEAPTVDEGFTEVLEVEV